MSATRVAIIDSGGANIASLRYAFKRLGHDAALTTDANTIKTADKVVLPGVGAAADSMQRLKDARLVDVIRSLTQPVLGICLGMQLMADASEEEDVDCLGVFPGIAARLPASSECPVPNMGWCALEKRKEHATLAGINNGDYFYFLHSYALPVTDYTLAAANHAQPFAAMIGRDNFVAVQFHPERSSKAGARLISNFLDSGA